MDGTGASGRDTARWAVYFAPAADTVLHRTGSRWLGRDAVLDRSISRSRIAGFSRQRLEFLTRNARHYGLHATLKPPFRLREGMSHEAFPAAVAALAMRLRPVPFNLALGRIGGFFALLATDADGRLSDLAAAAVRDLDGFREPADEQELARRRRANLTPRQEFLLRTWGYPFVLDEFRFHITLTRRISDPVEADRLRTALAGEFAPVLRAGHRIDALSVFRQESSRAPFLEVARLRLGDGACLSPASSCSVGGAGHSAG